MNFQSYAFIFMFLPLTLLVFFFVPKHWRFLPLLLSSIIFYSLLEIKAVFLLWSVIVITFLIAKKVAQGQHRRTWFWLGITLNLAFLALFKYATFALDTLQLLTPLLPAKVDFQLLLPIGLSFYIFNAIAYLSDVYRKEIPASLDFWHFATGMSFFASLLNGPLLRQSSIAAQFKNLHFDANGFSIGAQRFMQGFCKKVLLADALAPLARECFVGTPSSANLVFGSVLYSLQLFFDFSGYSDMAIGIARMFGIYLPENFNQPYSATSLSQFWQRWHMSLSGFLKQYVYIPLGGNRYGEFRTGLNLVLTMTLGGLWHGANWTFICWGVWNGIFLLLERMFQQPFPLPKWLAIPRTLVVILLGRLFFVAPDVQTALTYFTSLFLGNTWQLSQNVLLLATPERMLVACIAILGCLPLQLKPIWIKHSRLVWLPLFWVAIAFVAARTAEPFLYYKF